MDNSNPGVSESMTFTSAVVETGHPWADPVTVKASRPKIASGVALRVRMEVERVEVGFNSPVTPWGRPETLNSTSEANPD